MKIQRSTCLPENEMMIIKDMDMLVHNIVDSELKEKDNKIERLNNIIDELEKKLISVCENCYEDKYTAKMKRWIDKLKELKENNK